MIFVISVRYSIFLVSPEVEDNFCLVGKDVTRCSVRIVLCTCMVLYDMSNSLDHSGATH